MDCNTFEIFKADGSLSLFKIDSVAENILLDTKTIDIKAA
tara:strand:- start:215 stop:334 length:120 start_codon:yes stop_codon:yes gene_type:complete